MNTLFYLFLCVKRQKLNKTGTHMSRIPLPQHFNYSHLATPIVNLAEFNAGNYNLMVKRDDLTGLELSGNKIRKFDFLLKAAAMQGAERVITCGGIQSNSCRTAALAAKRCGMNITLVLKGTEPETWTGNFLLMKLSGAEIILVSEEEYSRVEQLMADYAHKSKEKVYIVPEGGSNATGSWGYVKCFYEIEEQNKNLKNKVDTIVVTTGSGGTHAGLLAGKMISGSKIEVISINVCDTAPFFQEKIASILQDFNSQYNTRLTWQNKDIKLIDGFVGEGYGKLSGKEEKQIIEMLQKNGIILDPVYTSKSFLGMAEMLKNGSIPGKNILYIHTGGAFGLFPFWKEIKQQLK